MFSGVFQQLFTQLPRQQNRANFTLQRDSGAASPDSLHRDVPHLAHSDARGADGLHDEGDPLPAQAERGGDQLFVVCSVQLSPGLPEQTALDLQIVCAAVRPAEKVEQVVQGCQRCVNGRRRIVFFSLKVLLPGQNGILRDRPTIQKQ